MTPLTYGGGVTKLEDIERLFKIGIEKVAINTAGLNDSKLITDASKAHGSQSRIASIDVKKTHKRRLRGIRWKWVNSDWG